jgi:ABC-type oligopeptide transport system substrate-binding subunit
VVAEGLIADEPGGDPVPPSRARRIVVTVVAILVVATLVVPRLPALLPPTDTPIAPGGASNGSVTILASEPASIDPARHGDAASAVIVAQLFETLTAFDTDLTLQPALAESWTVEDGGRRVVFQLRDGLQFSDGTPLSATDVVRSWRRLVTPGSLSPLASLLADVQGVPEILAGTAADPTAIGVTAEGDRRVVVDLVRPAADFPAIASSPPLAVVPASMAQRDVPLAAQDFVGSGGYRVTGVSGTTIELTANDRYWAGSPAIKRITVATDLAGRSPVEAFADGQLDVAPIGDLDARWIAYDKDLGPTLREVPSLTLEYYAFDTTKPPFDDARVRRAFAMAVDWRRIAALDDASSSVPATGMVPLGIPGRPDGDYLPPLDPEGAKRLLAEAGVDPATLPPVEFITSGGGHDDAVVADLREHLGVRVDYATMDFGAYTDRLDSDPPAMWSIIWVADYPSPNDFLGVLLGSGSTANEGRWHSEAFDEAIAEAGATTDATAAGAAYGRALAAVRDGAPAMPVTYGTSWSLTRPGLLGATPNGMGILRYAGLAWADGG